MCYSFMCHSTSKIVILKMSELEYICYENNEIRRFELFTWVVFLKQSYFIFDVIMVDQNAKK